MDRTINGRPLNLASRVVVPDARELNTALDVAQIDIRGAKENTAAPFQPRKGCITVLGVLGIVAGGVWGTSVLFAADSALAPPIWGA